MSSSVLRQAYRKPSCFTLSPEQKNTDLMDFSLMTILLETWLNCCFFS